MNSRRLGGMSSAGGGSSDGNWTQLSGGRGRKRFRRKAPANVVVCGELLVKVGKFFGHESAQPVTHEGPEEVAAGVAAFDFAAEVGVGFEGDVGAVGELANPVARELVVEVKAGFFDDAEGDSFGDDN